MKRAKRCISFLLAMCLACPSALALPEIAASAETEESSVVTAAETVQEDTSTQAGFSFAQSSATFDEGSGKHEIQIVRTGDVGQAASVTVVAYNMNTTYESDYLIYNGDNPVNGTNGASSLFQRFHDDGAAVLADDVDEAMMLGVLETQEAVEQAAETASKGDSEISVVSADEVNQSGQTMLQLEQLNITAAEMTVDFAAGQEIGSITVEILEDEVGEYAETFLLMLTSDSAVGDGYEQYVSIVDNEENAPQNTITFAEDCTQLEADAESGTAELWFARTGDLGTLSNVLLVKDGEPYGYVSFKPYQTEQAVQAEPGTYQLANAQGCQISEPATAVVTAADTPEENADNDEAVETAAARSPMKETVEEENTWSVVSPETNGLFMNDTVADEPDPILDSVPTYSAMPTAEDNSDVVQAEYGTASWFSEWAKGGSYEDENYIVHMGTPSNGLFKQGGHSSPSGVCLLTEDALYNCYKVSTEGTGSRCDDGYCYIDSINYYDFTGISAITTCYMVDDLDYDAEAKIGIHSNGAHTIEVEEGDQGEITYSFDRLIGVNEYVYFQNIDPSVVDDGCDIYFTNGFRMTKREYLFNILSPEGLTYTGESVPLAAEVEYEDSLLYKKIGDGTTATSTVKIRFTSPEGYPQKCIGYQLIAKDGSKSDIISLDDINSFVFDADFLKSYESKYCYETLNTSTNISYPTFQVRPVMAKQEVTDYKIQASGDGGTIKMVGVNDGDPLYKGEKVVFEADNTPTDKALSGVYVMARKAGTDNWQRRWTEWVPDDSKNITVTLDADYDEFVFQGVYEKDATMLRVTYAEGAKDNGTIVGGGGIVIESGEYVINDYYQLMAAPNDGYITKWESDGRVYYGDTFYYQLDGNANHNYITVDFIAESAAGVTKSSISGSLSVTNVNMFDSSLNSKNVLAHTSFSVPADADVECKGTTEDDGTFTIRDFSGVPGGTYSMLIEYGDYYRYATFVYGNTDSYNICVPQYGDGIFYPENVTVTLDGTDSDTNQITLQTEGNVEIGVQVYNQANSTYTIDYVALYFYAYDGEQNLYCTNAENPIRIYTADLTAEDTESSNLAAAGGTIGNLTSYTYKASTANFAADTYLYVDVVGTTTISTGDGMTEAYTISCGQANTGYEFVNPNVDKSLPILEEYPVTPGVQSGYSIDADLLEIPFCGCIDFNINCRDGAFFVRQYDVNDPSVYYLMAGYTGQTYWGTSEINDRFSQGKQTLESMQDSVEEGHHYGSLSAREEIANDGEGMEGGVNERKTLSERYGLETKLGIYPALMLRFTLKQIGNTSDPTDTDAKVIISGVDAAAGLDELFYINKPITVYGVPLYVAFSFKGQQYLQIQYTYNYNNDDGTDDAYTLDDNADDIYYSDGANESVQCFIAVPYITLEIKGGVGINNLVGAYIGGSFNFEIMVDVSGTWDAGGTIGGSVLFGGDLLVAGGELEIQTPDFIFGNKDLYAQLQQIGPDFTSFADAEYVESTSVASDQAEQQAYTQMQNMTFALRKRKKTTTLFDDSGISSDVLISNAFRGTQVKMMELDNGSIAAIALADNGADESSANFLSVVYAISNDGGNTWEKANYASKSENLQFGVEVYELKDRILVVWSEGDLDEVFAGKDTSALTASDMAKALNAMDLYGTYFDKENGEPIGEAFMIAENTSVAMYALEAIEDSSGNVYVYYARNNYPIDDNITIEDINAQERTIARAACKNGSDTWESTPITLQNDSGTETYRITEVVPFSHDGISGEAIVVDLDGNLVVHSEGSDELVPSIEDRQIFIRTYASEDGLKPSAVVPITEANINAQNVQIVSDDDRLYMFWNQDGEIVSLSDFVETKDKYDAGASSAVIVVDTETMEASVPEQPDGIGYSLQTNGACLDIGNKYSVSMSDDGDVVLCWINNEIEIVNDEAVTASEIYGVMRSTVQNESGMNELESNGEAIALTDEDFEIIHLDSVCTSQEDFLLAYTQLDAPTIVESTYANVCVSQSSFEPQLAVTDVSADEYPLPGSDMNVQVTVRNDGLEALKNVRASVKGVGSAQDTSDEPLEAGCERTINLTVPVPEDFSRTATLTATVRGTGMQSLISATGTTEVRYGAYFVPVEMARLYNIPNTSDYLSAVKVKNLGNAPGVPEITYLNYLGGESGAENGMKSQTITGPEEISAGGTGRVTYLLEDQLATQDNVTYMKVSLGDGYNQAAEGVVPTPKTVTAAATASDKHTVNISTTGAGTVTAIPRQANAGDTVILNAIAAEGYALSEISAADESGNAIALNGTGESYSFVMPDSDVAVTAAFKNTNAKHPFVDVNDTDWFSDAVQYVYDEGLMTGVDAIHFAPYMPMTRAMMMQVLYAAEGKPEAAGKNFTDVPADAWYADAVLWASQNGLTAGYGDGTFGPDDKVKREQIAVILCEYAEMKQMEAKDSGITLDQFADASSISNWATDSMLWAVNQGIISGRPGGILDPQGTGTRAELAQMLYALFTK